MAEISRRVSYKYHSPSLTTAAVAHTFSYLSALTGINFCEDEYKPEIWRGDSGRPSTTKLSISPINDYIAQIAQKLAIAIKLGPYSNDRYYPASPDIPTLSEIVSGFVAEMAKAEIIPYQERAITLWPDGKKFGLAVTHDVDILRRTVAGGIKLMMNNHLPGGGAALADSIYWRLGLRKNPYNQLNRWAELERELGIGSTYFVFAGERAHNFDPIYKPRQFPFDKLSVDHNNVSLHSGIGSHKGDGMAKAKADLEKISGAKISGVRPHYLSAFFPEYWQAARDFGFEYSSSFGFDDAIGFIDGIDLPFRPFDGTKDRPLPVLEIPIAIMDCGLIGDSSAESDEVFSRGAALIEKASKSGGLIVLDWHQRTLYNRDYPGWGKLFRALIVKASELGANFVTLEEISARMNSRRESV